MVDHQSPRERPHWNVGPGPHPEQDACDASTLPRLNDIPAQERLTTLQNVEPDVAQYLYESGRCAVAHAFADPLVDPDDLTDLRRLSADLDVVRALAEYLIEHELHVPRYP